MVGNHGMYAVCRSHHSVKWTPEAKQIALCHITNKIKTEQHGLMTFQGWLASLQGCVDSIVESKDVLQHLGVERKNSMYDVNTCDRVVEPLQGVVVHVERWQGGNVTHF